MNFSASGLNFLINLEDFMKEDFQKSFEKILANLDSTIDSDAFFYESKDSLKPIWTRQFNILNEYVEDPELTPVPKQVLIMFAKSLKTKQDSVKTILYREIYEMLHEYDYEYSEEFKENLLKYEAFNGHLTVAAIQNNEKIIHEYLDDEFDFLKVNELVERMKANPTGIVDSWNRDLSEDVVVQKNVLIFLNRSLIIQGQDWKDSLEHELTHFIQRIVELDKSLKKKTEYFGQRSFDNTNELKENIIKRTKLNKAHVDAMLNRFIEYEANPVEHDPSIKSCLNAFQRKYEREKPKIARNAWLDAELKKIDSYFNELFDKQFLKDKGKIASSDEMFEHKWLFALLTYRLMKCFGYDMDKKLKEHFKKFKFRDI